MTKPNVDSIKDYLQTSKVIRKIYIVCIYICSIVAIIVGFAHAPAGLLLSVIGVIVLIETTITRGDSFKKQKEIAPLEDFNRPIEVFGSYLNYKPNVYDKPTLRQLEYAKDLGLKIPFGASKNDVSCMISRALSDKDEDSTDLPSKEFAEYANSVGIRFSSYISKEGLIANIIYSFDDRSLAAFYAYAVKCSLSNEEIGNMENDVDKSVFFEFADFAIKDDSIVASIHGREATDYIKPNKGTKAYKAVVPFVSKK